MRCIINYFLAYFSTVIVTYWTKPMSQWKYSMWASLTYFRKSRRVGRLKFALFQWPERYDIEWFMLLFLGVLSEQKTLVPAHNPKLPGLKMACPCHKKNAGSHQAQRVTHMPFWTCALWRVHTCQFPTSGRVSVWCCHWKTKVTVALSEMPNGSNRASARVASSHPAWLFH